MSDQRVIEQRVSDEALVEALKRYGNNKAGDMYRLLLELQQRRAACLVCGSQSEPDSNFCLKHRA